MGRHNMANMMESPRQHDLNGYLEAQYKEGRREADDHYRELWITFLDCIPQWLHRTGEYAPSSSRPYGFNSSVNEYHFSLNLPDDYAPTVAIFVFKRQSKRWVLDSYGIVLQSSPLYAEQTKSKTLSGAILSAKEMMAEHQKRLAAAQSQLPTGEGAIQ